MEQKTHDLDQLQDTWYNTNMLQAWFFYLSCLDCGNILGKVTQNEYIYIWMIQEFRKVKM